MARFDPFSTDFERSSPLPLTRSASYMKLKPIGDTTPMATTNSYRERSKRLREFDNDKNYLIDDLILQLEATQRELEQLRIDHARHTAYYRDGQVRENQLSEQLRQVKSIMDRDPYVTVLIDGDGTFFTKELLSKGEKGGKEAAEQLAISLSTFAAERLENLQSPKIKLRIYANFKSLADRLVSAKMIDKVSAFGDFVQGFNGTKLLFDIVDAGTKKDRAGDKLSERFRLDLFNCHCHQIVLGVSHNSEYALLLQDTPGGILTAERVTLLEGVPFANDLNKLVKEDDYRTIKFDGIFSSKSLESPVAKSAQVKNLAAALPVLARIESNGNGIHTPSASASSTPQTTWASLAAQPVVATAMPSARTSTPAVSRKVIERNRLGQRIDKYDTTIPYSEITRIKKMKLCNIYYLQGPSFCTTASCSHNHDYPLTTSEKKILREVARMTPCYYKMDCEEPECIYGHRCPQSKQGENSCYYNEDCRFWGWGHGIDTRVVKTTKV